MSAYSFLRGAVMPEGLARAAAARGHRALVLADRENLCASITFLEAAARHGLHPILGCDLVLPLSVFAKDEGDRAATTDAGDRAARMVVLCRDISGYRNLCRLISRFHLSGPQAAAEFLDGGPGGWFVLSPEPRVWPFLRDRLPAGSLGALLTRPTPFKEEERLLEEARLQGIAPVAARDVSTVTGGDEKTRLLLRAIRRQELLGRDPAQRRGSVTNPRANDRGMPGGDASARMFADLPQAVARAAAIAERCSLALEDLAQGRFLLPRVAGREAPRTLRRLCDEGLVARGLARSIPAWRRLETEMAAIATLGFVDYFLVVADIVGWARAQGIRLIGRGSGAASLVAYLLGVTNVDPLRANLCFERFFHPLRRDLPDLDIDIAWDRRDEVLRYALTRFGEGRAAMMGTHPFFRARGAFREASRALGLTDADIARGARRLPHAFFGQRVPAVEPADKETPSEPRAPGTHDGGPDDVGGYDGGYGGDDDGDGGDEGPAPARALDGRAIDPEDELALRALARQAAGPLQRAALAALAILGLPRMVGTHPAGVVLADRRIEEIVALQPSPGGLAVTQLEMKAAERIGLVKIDLLGNRSLGTIDEAARRIAEQGIALDLERLPGRDEATAGLLARGETLGCMQLESPAMRSLVRQLKARDLDMVTAAIALIRPGPSGSGMKQAFIRRSHGREECPRLHPALEPVLADTFGLPLYDEDVIKMAAAVTGGSLAEGDMLRRAVIEAARRAKAGEESAAETMHRLETGFLSRAQAHRIDARTAREVWQALVRFAGYSFCKAHSAGYGVLACQSAYLKAHHPGPFFAAVLNHQRGMYPERVYAEEARRAGLRLTPPCVARGERGWRWEPEQEPARREGGPGRLICGLSAVRGLHEATIDAILGERRRGPFHDFADFAARVGASAPELETLALAGAFDDAFGLDRAEIIRQLRRWLRRPRGKRSARGGWASAQQERAGAEQAKAEQQALPLERRAPCMEWCGDEVASGRRRAVSLRHRAGLERRLLGMSLALPPTALFPSPRNSRVIVIGMAIAAARDGAPAREIRVRAIVSAKRAVRDARGRALVFLTLEDHTGMVEAILREGEGSGRAFASPRVDDFVEVRGIVESNYGSPSLSIREFRVFGSH
ncbi:MAG: DNA polymerase III subunit alpha [Candidatus Eisenbacteria bacterium]|nr:DNA polymerase III subunit alpha [Candidatus Eisenbacteria bacterium]